MPPDSITRFFEHPNNNSRGARIIAGVSAEDAALIIRHVSLDQAARWLGALQPKELAAAVMGLHDDEVVSILQRLPHNVVNGRGRAFVEEFGEAELVRLLAQLPGRAIGEWLARLRGSLTNSSVNQLTTIMRQAAR
jgi:Mg/Co/Ni transporter MgtE